MGKKLPTADQAAEKWARNYGSSGTSMQQGADRVTESPGAAAVRNKAEYVRKMSDPQTHSKWEQNTGAVTLEEWRTNYKSIGVQRAQQGAAKGKTKQQRFLSQFLPYLQASVDSLPARGGMEANLARMVQNARNNAAFKRTR